MESIHIIQFDVQQHASRQGPGLRRNGFVVVSDDGQLRLTTSQADVPVALKSCVEPENLPVEISRRRDIGRHEDRIDARKSHGTLLYIHCACIQPAYIHAVRKEDMPRSSAADAARTAERIRECALDLFAEHGYSAVAVEDVAHAAQVTRGAVYHHFRNKDGLFRAVARHLHETVASRVAAAAEASGPDPKLQLKSGSHAFLEAITEAAPARILLIDAPAIMGWQEWRSLDAANSQELLGEALAAAGIEQQRGHAMTALLSGAMNEAALWVVHQDSPAAALETALEGLDHLLTSLLR